MLHREDLCLQGLQLLISLVSIHERDTGAKLFLNQLVIHTSESVFAYFIIFLERICYLRLVCSNKFWYDTLHAGVLKTER